MSPNTLAFGTVTIGQYVDRVVTLSNPGADVRAGNLVSSCPSYRIVDASGDSLSGRFSLGPGQSTNLIVRFRPSTLGTEDCALTTGLPGQPYLMAHGAGQATTGCSVSPTRLGFGSVLIGHGAVRTFTITNNGSGILEGTMDWNPPCGNFSVAGDFHYALAPGQSQTAAVFFSPPYNGSFDCFLVTGVPGCDTVFISAHAP